MKEQAFKACLEVIEREGWKNFSFTKASQNSGIPLNVFHEHFSSPAEVMIFLFHKIDQELLKHQDLSLETLSHKDALFELFMARFDAAQPYKPVLKSFWKDWLLTPEDTPALACQGFSSMAWVLEAAGLNPRGLKGVLRIQGLTTLYLLTLRVWLEDDSPDLGKTMAYLDKGLTRLEKLAGLMHLGF